MHFLINFWHDILYVPLYNFLIFLYTTYADYNLGVAIIILTVLLRLILLPFTVLIERGRLVGEELTKEVEQIKRDFAKDHVKQKLAIRLFLKKKKVRHWAKGVSLGIQALVLILLYQVFIAGVSSIEQLHLLYPWINRPDFVDTHFFGFDLAARNMILPAVVAGYLFAELLIKQWLNHGQASRSEQIFTIFFPAFSFLALAILPSVKSIFILTSLLFSTILTMLVGLILAVTKKPAKKPA